MASSHPPRLILVTGIMAAGKSSTAQRLAERLSPSAHLRGDAFRRMIVNGREERLVPPSDEALRQVDLRYRISAAAAALYLEAGFNVVYQDVIFGLALDGVVRRLVRHDLHVVVLCPRPEVVAARDEQREKDAYVTAEPEHYYRVLTAGTPRLGLWIDTSEQEVDETVCLILAGLARARVTAADLGVEGVEGSG
jgi:predicted kinase